jgi:hypothetical protein
MRPSVPMNWRSVVIVALLAVTIASVPTLVGLWTTPDDAVFSGLVIGADDGYSYLGKLRLGVRGLWSFHIFYTDEPHEAVPLTFLPYILPGQLLRVWTSPTDPALYTTLIGTFHVMRVGFGVLLVFSVAAFIRHYLTEHRTLALVVALFGGGWGFIVAFLGTDSPPPEWFIPEGFSLLVLMSLPHLALARSAIIVGWLLLLASSERRLLAVAAGLVWLVAGLSVPFYLAVIYLTLGVWGLLLWTQKRTFPTDAFVRALIAGLITLPLFGFYAWAFSRNPIFAQWSAQNILTAPPPHHYLLAYGGLLAFGVWALPSAWRDGERGALLIAWGLVGLLAVYLPINVQRRLAEGVLLPLAILAVMGLAHLPVRRLASPLVLLALTLPSSLLLLVGTSAAIAGGSEAAYVSRVERDALVWLAENTPLHERGAVILTRFEDGTRVPAYTNLRVYVGHGPETLDYDAKTATAAAYYASELDTDERAALYAEHHIELVWFGTEDAPPQWTQDELRLLYDTGGVQVFAVD